MKEITHDNDETLRVSIKYGELEAEIEGTFDKVWKFTNNFFKQIKMNLGFSSKSAVIPTEGRSVPEILVELRNSGFFDEPKSSKQCFNKLKGLGKTGITPNAASMALKNLVKKGELKRVIESKGFAYIAPYVELEGD